MTDLRITVRNTSEVGGTFLTPVYFGFHDGSFDLFNAGEAASAGLEGLAEDGTTAGLAAERLAADGDSQGAVVAGDRGPIATQEVTSAIVSDVDGVSNGYVSLAAMILPSNDAFIGTDDAIALFDDQGDFLGAQNLIFEGSNVYDAGTEVNTEQDAAFINQTAPNTGVTEGGVVTLHPGFNGSEGNPGGDQIILGGTNAFGAPIDEEAADFTRPGAQIAEIHINTVIVHESTARADILQGGDEDDIIQAGAGRDRLYGGDGYDDLSGGTGQDKIYGGEGDDLLSGDQGRDHIRGDAGRDEIDGGAADDKLYGGDDADIISGGQGRDDIYGDDGNDVLAGGRGRDNLFGGYGDDLIFIDRGDDTATGGEGSDTFLLGAASGQNEITDFEVGIDLLSFAGTGLAGLSDVQDAATQTNAGTLIDLGNGSVLLRGTELVDLSADDLLF